MVTYNAKIRSISSPSEQLPCMEGSHAEQIKPVEFGAPGSLHYRVAFFNREAKEIVSPWHNISLYRKDGLISCVCKTPAGSWVKYEVAGDEPFNPLRVARARSAQRARPTSQHAVQPDLLPGNADIEYRPVSATFQADELDSSGAVLMALSTTKTGHGSEDQGGRLPAESGDTRKGRPGGGASVVRPAHYADNLPWNLGLLPQTWAASGRPPRTYCPLEVVEIGADTMRQPGEVYLVKPLGAYSVDDGGGVLTWKIIAIAADDAMAPMLQDAADVNLWLPGMLEKMREWLRTCVCMRLGEKESTVHLNSWPVNFAVTKTKIAEFHEAWGLFPGRHLVHPKAALLAPQKTIHPADLEKAWEPFTSQEFPPAKGPVPAIPNSCPTTQSSVMFDPNWLQQTASKGMPAPASPSPAKEPGPVNRAKSLRFGGTLKRARRGLMSFLTGHSKEASSKHQPTELSHLSSSGRVQAFSPNLSKDPKPRRKSEPKPSPVPSPVGRQDLVDEGGSRSQRSSFTTGSPFHSPKPGPGPSPSSQSNRSLTPSKESSAPQSPGSQSDASPVTRSPAVSIRHVAARSPWEEAHQSQASARPAESPLKDSRGAGEPQEEEEEAQDKWTDNDENEERMASGVRQERRTSLSRRPRRKGRPRGRSLELRRRSEAAKIMADVKLALAQASSQGGAQEEGYGAKQAQSAKWRGSEEEESESEGQSRDSGALSSDGKPGLRRSLSLQELREGWEEEMQAGVRSLETRPKRSGAI